MKKILSIILTITLLMSTFAISVMSSTAKAEESDIWFYIGNGDVSKASKTYTKTDYPDAADALQESFDDVTSGAVTLSASALICVNQNVTLTKQVRYTGTKVMRIKNLYTMTYVPVDPENATTAVYCNGQDFYLYGESNAYALDKQFVPYGNNAFFEYAKLQCGGYFNGDISVKDCMYFGKLGNYSMFNISGNLIISGKSATDNIANTYKGTGITINGNFDYSGVDEANKAYIATIATTATINGKIISEPVDPLEVTSTMLSGAEIRLNEQRGIRFLTKLDTAKIAELRADGYTVEYGTLIAPKNLLDGAELTFDLDENNYLDIPYQADEWHKGEEGQIAGSVVEIKDANISRDFIGRGYVKVTKDGNTTVTYADYANNDISNNTRSLAYVANALKNDTAKYDQLDAITKELVVGWAEKLA